MNNPMSIIILGLSILVIGVLVGLIIKLITKRDNGLNYLKTDIVDLRNQVVELNKAMQQTLESRLDKTTESMQVQLRQSSAIVNDVSKRLTKLDETNKQVINIANDLQTLQNVLQNPKQRGVFGEFYLNSVLENVLAPNQWQQQYRFQNGDIVDAVIFLDKKRILPIDSKFSLENYNRYVAETNKENKAKLLAKVKNDLKGRIDETAKYIRPSENTMEFAFMFIPSESLYYDLLISNVGSGGSARDLIEYAFRDKRVIITSPTSFMAYLETVLQGLRSLQIEEQAKEIQKRVSQLGVHIAKYDDFLKKLGNSLNTTVNHYDNAYREFTKIDRDISKIDDQHQANIEVLEIDRPHNN